VAGLLTACLDDPEPRVRATAGRALTVWAGPEDSATLIRLLDSPDTGTRQTAMTALGRFKEKKAVAAIATRLKETGDYKAAEIALTAIGGPEVEKEVLKVLQGKPRVTTRTACVRILGKVGTKDSLPALEALEQELSKGKGSAASLVSVRNAIKEIKTRNKLK
jgi:HEAT repeat protein